MNPLDSGLYYPQTEAGCLRISGQDAVAFIQRQSTNDVRNLAPGRSVLTVLTSPAGRILDVLRLVGDDPGDGPGDKVIHAFTLPGYGPTTARYLKSRIFFMDKVAVADTSLDWYQVDLAGRGANHLLTRLGLEPPAPDGITTGKIAVPAAEAVPVHTIGQTGIGGLGFRLVGPSTAADAMETALAAAGARRLAADEYEVLRVESGLPWANAELTEAFTPLEVGLDGAISSSKGCYTGQEVIARQLTYDKVTQHLSGLRLDKPVQAGEPVRAEGRTVGTVTSTVLSPDFGPIALAILKRPFHEAGRIVEVGGEEVARAKVTALPFIQ